MTSADHQIWRLLTKAICAILAGDRKTTSRFVASAARELEDGKESV